MHAEHLVNELVNYHCPTRRRKRNQSDASDWFRLRLKSSASEWFHNLPRRRRLIPQTFFHTKTRSRKHFFIEKPYPANSFFAKSCIPQTLFIPKPYPANSFSRKPLSRTRVDGGVWGAWPPSEKQEFPIFSKIHFLNTPHLPNESFNSSTTFSKKKIPNILNSNLNFFF